MLSGFKVFLNVFPIIISLAALILTGLSLSGSRTKDIAFNASTYLIKIDLSNARMDEVFSNNDRTLLQLGFSELYSFGLWGYCKGERITGDSSKTIGEQGLITDQDIKEWFANEDYNVTYCSKPKSLFSIDIPEVLLGDADENSHSISINLPQAVRNQMKTVVTTGHTVFIVLFIAVCSLGLSMLCLLFSFLFDFFYSLAAFFGVLSFIALIIGAGSSLAVFNTLRTNFNDADAASTYGILATLGSKKFYIMVWAAVVLTFIAVVFNFVSICLIRFGRKEPSRTEKADDENPFIGYEEK